MKLTVKYKTQEEKQRVIEGLNREFKVNKVSKEYIRPNATSKSVYIDLEP